MFKKKDTADSEQNNDVKGAKGKSQAQVLVLLLLVAVGAYIYFFTGLIKPREEAPVTPPQPAQVKKPMPPRQPDQKAEPQAASATAPAPAPTPAPAAPKAAPAPASAPPAGAQKPVAQAPAKPQASAPAQPAKPAKAETAKAPAKAAPVAANKAAGGKSAAPAKPADKGTAAAAKQAGAAGKAAKKQDAAEKKAPAGAFTLKTADLAFARDVARAEAQLKKAGIKPVAVHKTVKAEPMNRLFYAEYPTREAAAADLEQLKTKAPDAFMVPEGGKFSVYAGSYLKEGRGAIEQDRLFDKGIRLVMKKTQVKIPVTYITAGSFASQQEAKNAAAKLKKSGVAVAVMKK